MFFSITEITQFNKKADIIFKFNAGKPQGSITINMENRTVTLRNSLKPKDRVRNSDSLTIDDVFKDYFTDVFEGLTVFYLDDEGKLIEEPIEHA